MRNIKVALRNFLQSISPPHEISFIDGLPQTVDLDAEPHRQQKPHVLVIRKQLRSRRQSDENLVEILKGIILLENRLVCKHGGRNSDWFFLDFPDSILLDWILCDNDDLKPNVIQSKRETNKVFTVAFRRAETATFFCGSPRNLAC